MICDIISYIFFWDVENYSKLSVKKIDSFLVILFIYLAELLAFFVHETLFVMN